ncbi:MAG: efflux RND transporter permease subunit [Bacteroidales bacterium]|nr:efflux RND transporter permease subunit [Bacteroidales bacterium]
MLRRLVERPIAVTMTIIAILIVGIVAIGRLPISLMPNVDIPQITVQVAASGTSAREINEQVIKPLRMQLIQIPSLEDIRCEAVNGSGNIFMEFSHKSDTDLNFIEVNEKIDKVLSSLPKEVERPKVIKASATDIPAFFINLTIPGSSVEKFLELSRFAKEVIARRVEQVPQVALVDISGTLGTQILIEPDEAKLQGLGIGVDELEKAVGNNNVTLGNLSIRDGYYQWNVSFDSQLKSREDIEAITLNLNGRIYTFGELAKVSEVPQESHGMVQQGAERAITMAVIKQSDAQMAALKSSLEELTENFAKEYPHIEFTVTRNQTELLDYSIDNLKSNILVGAILAVLVIFLFMRDYRSPLLVMITIPLSLVVSLLLLYLLGISINIISLSGLILGLGMMVDNSIIVIDNITQYWQRGSSLKEAVVEATREVVAPMLSSVLTTCSVFVPLIFLSGISGALFYDQAMAVTMALFTSLFVAVLVIPVYYMRLYKGQERKPARKKKSFLDRIDDGYEKGLKWTLRHQKTAWGVFFALIAGTFLFYGVLEKSKLPPVTHKDIILNIDWNAPITLEESRARCSKILEGMEGHIAHYDLLIGKQDFLLSHSGDITPSQVKCYIDAHTPDDLAQVEPVLLKRIQEKYPQSTTGFEESSNIFNTIFADNEAPLVAMISRKDSKSLQPDQLNRVLQQIKERLPQVYIEPVLWQEQILLVTQPEQMALYNLGYGAIYQALSTATKENTLFSIKQGSFSTPVVIGDAGEQKDLLAVTVKNAQGAEIPLSYVLKERRVRDLKNIVQGRDGDYYPLNINVPDNIIPAVEKAIKETILATDEFAVEFAGGYYTSRGMIGELAIILIISLLLLYFILAAQFESLVQPFIILSEIVADLTGALLLLWICGAGINLMSMIGIVVMCGIIINDSILKVDTINRLRKQYSLLRAIMVAGNRRLSPILMTSLTTILAIAPFLVRGNMGADLQFPLSLALIGGMIVGTAVSIFFIPVLYYNIYKPVGKKN